MIKPLFSPLPSGEFTIEHIDPQYESSIEILENISSGRLRGKIVETKLKDIIKQYPYNFEAIVMLSQYYTMETEFDKACEVRFAAVQSIIDILPEDEEFSLDFENDENYDIGTILINSGVDCFLMSQFEVAASIFEALLDLDPEDHFEATKHLAYCYIALEEKELLELSMFDIDDKDPEKIIMQLWAAHKFKQEITSDLISKFKANKVLHQEFTADSHVITPEYIEDLDSERPSRKTLMKSIWLKTEHIWNENPDFIDRLRKL